MWPFDDAGAPIIARKRDQRSAALQSAEVYVEVKHAEFLQVDATAIVQNISDGRWTAVQVLEAYIARAAEAHHHTNCLTEIMFDTARLRARLLDEEFVKTGQIVGPLHGVPMSFKDQYEVVGYDTTVGFTRWADMPASRNADTVNVLLAAGAVPFVKTNLPQAMLGFECSNPLWGRTTHPLSSAYTCGGSSGGEAALLAASGSALGFGSDIACSIRTPASFCGLYALKPGHGRVSHGGALVSNSGFEGVPAVVGPMGRSVRDLTLAARVVFGRPDELGVVAPLPFREVELPKRLNFGFYTDDGFVKSSPACERAVLETIAALRQAGHECVELDWPFATEPLQILSEYFSADGYKMLLVPLGPDVKKSSLALSIGDRVLGDSQFVGLARNARPKSVAHYHQITMRRKELGHRLQSEIWEAHNLDAIIAPVQAMPTIPHGAMRDLSPLMNTAMMYNVVDSPVGVVPVTRVDPTKDALVGGTWPASKTGGSWIVAQACARAYDPLAMDGIPLAVQIVGKKWEDEKVLAVMDIVDRALGKRDFGAATGASIKLTH